MRKTAVWWLGGIVVLTAACRGEVQSANCRDRAGFCDNQVAVQCVDGVEGVRTDCGDLANGDCLDGTCVSSCTPEEAICLGGTAGHPHTCSADGRTWVQSATCLVSEYCIQGICVLDVCPQGTSYCVGGEAGDPYACDADGSAETQTATCAALEYCAGGVCLTDICDHDADASTETAPFLSWSHEIGFETYGPNVPALAVVGDEVVAMTIDNTNQIFHSRRRGRMWNNPAQMPGALNHVPALDTEGGEVVAAARASDRAVYLSERVGGVWSGWEPLGGGTDREPVVARTTLGIDVAIVGLDNKLWVNRKTAAGTLVGWTGPIGDFTVQGDLALAKRADTLVLVARDSSGGQYRAVERDAAGNWGAWIDLQGGGKSDPALFSDGTSIDLAIIGTDDAVWVTHNVGGTWGAWSTIGGGLVDSLSIGGTTDTRFVVARGRDGMMWSNLERGGLWLGWSSFGAFDGASFTCAPNECLFVLRRVGGTFVQKSYFPVQLTADAFSYVDYSVVNHPSGGRTLAVFLTDTTRVVRLSYTLEPDDPVMHKSVGLYAGSILPETPSHLIEPGPVELVAAPPVFRLRNGLVSRTFAIQGSTFRTCTIGNERTGVEYPVQSDEFALAPLAGNHLGYLDVERLSLLAAPTTHWSGNVSDPLIFDDMFLWVDNPLHIPMVHPDWQSYLVERLYPLSAVGATDQFASHRSALGALADADGVSAFRRWFLDATPPPTQFFFDYNTWWSVGYPFTEAEIRTRIALLKNVLATPHGVFFDAFTLDDGWPKAQSIWEINTNVLPDGFANIRADLEAAGSSLGLWFSPSAAYPTALDPAWALANNYPTRNLISAGRHILCLVEEPGQTSYADALKERIRSHVVDYEITRLKLDGFLPCHGFSAEEGARFREIREYVSQGRALRQEANFGPYGPGVVAPQGWVYVSAGDYPSGILPALSYKEAYTTTRDQAWHSYGQLAVPFAWMAQFGVMIQTDEDWQNDAVVNLLRGTSLISWYVDPAVMQPSDWSYVASLLRWSRRNAPQLLADTILIGGMPKSGGAYGYAHGGGNDAYVLLRNPTIDEQTIDVTASAAIGLSAAGSYFISIIYPYRATFPAPLSLGQSQSVALEPFQTLVLHVRAAATVQNELLGIRHEILGSTGSRVLRTWAAIGTATAGAVWRAGTSTAQQVNVCPGTSSAVVTASTSAIDVNGISGSFDIATTSDVHARLVVLVDSDAQFDETYPDTATFLVDGGAQTSEVRTSEIGPGGQWWRGLSPGEPPLRYWKYFVVNLPSGTHGVSFDVNDSSGMIPDQARWSAHILYWRELQRQDLSPSTWLDDNDVDLRSLNTDQTTERVCLGDLVPVSTCAMRSVRSIAVGVNRNDTLICN